MNIQRVALIFDSVLRPETAGVYCHRALERFVEVQHFQPHELEQVPKEGFDLYLNIDDGLRYHLPPERRPSAFWAIDTHLDFDRCREKAPRFDVPFLPLNAMGSSCYGGSGFLPPIGCLWPLTPIFIASTTRPNNMTSPTSPIA